MKLKNILTFLLSLFIFLGCSSTEKTEFLEERKKKLDNKIKKEQNEARKKEVINKDAANKPLFNLYKKNEWKIHLERLDKYKKSMWGGEVFYVGKRGGIYTIRGNGIRDYRW